MSGSNCSYFRHYLMYKYAFTNVELVELIIENSMPEVEVMKEHPAFETSSNEAVIEALASVRRQI